MTFLLHTFLGKERNNHCINNYINTSGLKCFAGFPVNHLALVQACSSRERMLALAARRDPLRLWLTPWGILGFLASGKRTEVPLGPGLALSPQGLRGERSVSVFPQRVFHYSGKHLGKTMSELLHHSLSGSQQLMALRSLHSLPRASHVTINGHARG